MNKRKSLKDLSWNVDEPTYRADSALSYSLLSAYARGGHKALRESYYEKKKLSTVALSFGSLLDTIITNPGEFDNLYLVTENGLPSEKTREVVDKLFNLFPRESSLVNVPYDDILKAYNESFDNNWKSDTKVKKIIEEGDEYFKLLFQKKDRVLVSKNDYLDALDCQEALLTSPYTSFIFDGTNPNVEVFYQLKFKISMDGDDPLAWEEELIEGPTYRVMFDILLVNHDQGVVYPIDLKTTSKDEEAFDSSIAEYRYDLQANSYRDVLIDVLKTSRDYNKYSVAYFAFVCINRHHLKPVLWTFWPTDGDTMKTPAGTIVHNCDWKKLYERVKAEIATGNPDYSTETIQKGHKEYQFIGV
jgi:hypothetical protein